MSFLKNGAKATFAQDVFRPTSFGALTKDNLGQYKLVGRYEHKPVFPEQGEDYSKYGGTHSFHDVDIYNQQSEHGLTRAESRFGST